MDLLSIKLIHTRTFNKTENRLQIQIFYWLFELIII